MITNNVEGNQFQGNTTFVRYQDVCLFIHYLYTANCL